MTSGNVRGSLFVDYVRMLRAAKHVDWPTVLPADDLVHLRERVDPAAWYPMVIFERFGVAILDQLSGGDVAPARLWGRQQLDAQAAAIPGLLATGDPRESLMRFGMYRRTFFDFDALVIDEVNDQGARLRVRYGMGPRAEEAACLQTLGFFERLVEAAGGRGVEARFASEAWRGAPATVIELGWR